MHTDMRAATQAHLDALQARVPGLVTGLLLTGSAALGDYRPGVSDLDFVAVTEADPTAEELAALKAVHEKVPTNPSYDGVYLTRDRLLTSPAEGQAAPQILAGDFVAAKPGGQVNPVTWLEMRSAIVVHGERPQIGLDADLLREWLEGNLAGYWAQWVTQVEAHAATLPDDEPFSSYLILWGVLGPGRLRYTLETGEVISKTAAGEFAAARYPRWRELALRAVAVRAGGHDEFTPVDARAMTELMTAVIEG